MPGIPGILGDPGRWAGTMLAQHGARRAMWRRLRRQADPLAGPGDPGRLSDGLRKPRKAVGWPSEIPEGRRTTLGASRGLRSSRGLGKNTSNQYFARCRLDRPRKVANSLRNTSPNPTSFGRNPTELARLRPEPWLQISRTLVRTSVASMWWVGL